MTIVVTSTPSGGSLQTLRTAIQQRGYSTDSADAQNEMINSYYRRVIGMRRWPFLEASGTFPTVVGTGTYNMPALLPDLLHIRAVRAEIGTKYPALTYRDQEDFRDYEHADRSNGSPMYWTRIGNAIRLWPKPDRVYTITVDYVKDAPDLVGDSDVTQIPSAYQDVLVWGPIIDLAYRERDYAGMKEARANYQSLVNDMINEYGLRQQQTSSEVASSGYWDAYDSSSPRSGWLSY